ncbi:MAG: HEAT repeat domain-containing protein [Candidatus Brocadiia bacterium]
MASFEELARQLAEAAEPAARIRAAEKLAEIDDPRVALTLARALADPHEAVRQRVEELLSQFSREGNLRALLDEAQRIADLLATEVERLRGFAPQEAPAAPTEPLEPPPDHEGACAIVRLTGGPLNVKRAGRIVAERLKRPLFEITREVHRTKGFIAREVASPVARALVRELAEAGVVAGAVPEERVPQPLEPVRVRDLTYEPRRLRGRVLPKGEEAVAWASVELVVAGRLELDLQPQAIEEDWSPLTPPIRSQGSRRSEEPVYDYLVEMFAGEPLRRLRLVTHDLDFEVMQRRVSSFGKVARMARELLRHVPRRRVSAGVWRLADRDEDSWEDLTFLSPLGFEDYVTWQRLLLALDLPLPR